MCSTGQILGHGWSHLTNLVVSDWLSSCAQLTVCGAAVVKVRPAIALAV